MKNITVNVQMQFDQYGDEDTLEYVTETLCQMVEVLQHNFNDIQPIIFTNSIDKSDMHVEDYDEN